MLNGSRTQQVQGSQIGEAYEPAIGHLLILFLTLIVNFTSDYNYPPHLKAYPQAALRNH